MSEIEKCFRTFLSEIGKCLPINHKKGQADYQVKCPDCPLLEIGIEKTFVSDYRSFIGWSRLYRLIGLSAEKCSETVDSCAEKCSDSGNIFFFSFLM